MLSASSQNCSDIELYGRSLFLGNATAAVVPQKCVLTNKLTVYHLNLWCSVGIVAFLGANCCGSMSPVVRPGSVCTV